MIDGFSPYASLGFYAISGSVAGARLSDRFSIGENTPEATAIGSLTFQNPGSNPLSYNITSGNTGGTFSIDSTGTVSVANSSLQWWNDSTAKDHHDQQGRTFRGVFAKPAHA